MRYWLLTFFACLVASCNQHEEGLTDRTLKPEAALNSARAALHRKDLFGYFDTLTDEAVRETLVNSINICLFSYRPQAQKLGRSPSVGCKDILTKYGWVKPIDNETNKISAAWRESLINISDPRSMVSELEKNHRKEGAGSSFVWEYLDPVTIIHIDEHGSRAVAKVIGVTRKRPLNSSEIKVVGD